MPSPMSRRTALSIAVAGIILAAMAGPTGRLAIQMHDVADRSPQRIEATLQLGKAALTFLLTWSSRAR